LGDRALRALASYRRTAALAPARWGADLRECGWHFWKPGARSWEILPRIRKPDPALDLFICGEAYSTSQALVEGALESAAAVVSALAGGPLSATREG
jgi:hypothetical protein